MSISNNITRKYLYNISKILFFLGAPNYWFEELDTPKFFKKIQNYIAKLIVVIMFLFVSMEWLAFYTQENLSEKQSVDLSLFSFSHPILYSYVFSLNYYVEKIREVMFNLTEKVKNMFNDEEVEQKMIKKAKFFTTLYTILFSISLVFYGVDGIIQVVYADGTFVTVVTAWPDVEDKSTKASVARIIAYLIWWLFMIRISTVYTFVIPLTVCLSHQYRHLCSYFNSLNEIFDRNISQVDKERKYEDGFKIGITLHSDTLWCTNEIQKICNIVFGGQILVNITVLILLMSQMVTSERTLGNALATLSTASAMLISTGCLMWNAGDVTVEASHLATAMFESGWQNCRRHAAVRVRSLLLIAMWQSQKPVQMRCLGIVKLSYASYLSIVKSSYSVFSVLY